MNTRHDLSEELSMVEKFWNVMKARRAEGYDNAFWKSPGPTFKPRRIASILGLTDNRGNLTDLGNRILCCDEWEKAYSIMEANYLGILSIIEKAESNRLSAIMKMKQEFAPLQVIPYAQWKWPWLYIAKVYYEPPSILRSQHDKSPYVIFPKVFKNDESYREKWETLIRIGWINELGEVREEIGSALRERERRLLETGGVIEDNNGFMSKSEAPY